MSVNNATRHAVILGALLHDIGKFVQRTKDNPTRPRQDHCHWGEEWFQNNLAEKLTPVFSEEEKNIIRTAIGNHHGHEKYISLADIISAGMERIPLEDEEKGDPFSKRLISIFSRVSISDKHKKEKYYKLTYLHKEYLQETFPVNEDKCSTEEYTDLLNEFENELQKINFDYLSSCAAVDLIYFLLLKYTWCIPSAVYKDEPDISLFDHFKTTAAVAGCLYGYNQEYPGEELSIASPAFQLVSGDISGIQDYIFNVLVQQGKVAKRLRARSLFIQLISEIATHQIIHQFNLPLSNIISSAGGNFYILLPNTKDVEDRLEGLQIKFDSWTYEKFKGEIFLSLSWVKTSGKELGKFNEILEKIKIISHRRKYNSHHSVLVNSKWQKEKFLLDEIIHGDEQACSGCHLHPVSPDSNKVEPLCEQCFNDTIIGKDLPKTKYIAFFNDDKHRFPVLNYSFELLNEFPKDHQAYLVFALNNTGYSGLGFRYIANHIPLSTDVDCSESEHQHDLTLMAFFDCIANASVGDNLLGYIKADVDNMGKIFRYGFKPEEPLGKYKIPGMKPSISRFSSLSRMLEIFFAGYLQKRLENEYKDLYTIFSGGDDFFMVGPWNRIIDFAQEMRREFSRFTGNNPDFSFSAGIILSKPHEPISFYAEEADENLRDSKQAKDKDKVTLFNQTVSWDELNKILIEAQKLIRWLQNEPPVISRGFAYNLREYGEMADKSGIFKQGDGIDTRYLKFIPLLVYDITRNLTKEWQKEAYLWTMDLRPTTDNPQGGNNLRFLKTIMEYVLTYTRG